MVNPEITGFPTASTWNIRSCLIRRIFSFWHCELQFLLFGTLKLKAIKLLLQQQEEKTTK